MAISAAEQYFIELTNRARLDPVAEAERLGTTLNEGLAAGTISGDAKQVLAPNELMEDAAQAHSEWMLATNTFSHTGSGGSSARARMEAEGYAFTGSWTWGENISWRGTSGTINLENSITSHYEGLFYSEGHRKNTMNDAFREIGIAQVAGSYTNPERTWSASMLTTKFAKSGSEVFITGVAYSDTDNDDFYSMGEGQSGLTFFVGNYSDTTGSAGGYAVEVYDYGDVFVTVTGGGVNATFVVDTTSGNVKIDIVDKALALFSADAQLIGGIVDARLLGIEGLELAGNGEANELTGNRGANIIRGEGGNDLVRGADGADVLYGGNGNDTLDGENGWDSVWGGAGNDSLIGGAGVDTIGGGAGDDRIYGGTGNDVVYGGNDNDLLYGEGGRDTAYGGGGQDTIWGGSEADTIGGGGQNDSLSGGDGGDLIWGGHGNDAINGDAGADTIYGGTGDDVINLGGGDDVVYGGPGNDMITGGAGSDTFVFADAQGWNKISDFDATSNSEKLDLSDVTALTSTSDVLNNHAFSQNGGTMITDNVGLWIFLEGVDINDLGSGDFLFV